MYISGLIAYLRATTLPWYLDLFKPTARARSLSTTWDPTTRQLTSILDSNFTDTLLQDPLYDLTNSAAAFLSASQNEGGISNNTSIIFDVPITDGTSIGFYRDNDSISTFRSKTRSALKKNKEKTSTVTSTTVTSTPTQSVSFAPFLYGPKFDDTSVSKMSDTASKVATLENRFEKMETQFSSSFARLESILSGLRTQSLAVTSNSLGSRTTPVQTLANHPTPDNAGDSMPSGVAGRGS